MRLRPTHRVPLLLLGCLVTALVFPRACAGERVDVGLLLPATAALTASSGDDGAAGFRENQARLVYEIVRLEETLSARPLDRTGPLGDVEFAPTAANAPPLAIPARLRQRDASATRRSFLIDAGTGAGVHAGLPVIHGNSLVGIVVNATPRGARVLRVDDPSAATALPAVVLRDAAGVDEEQRAHGVARGTGGGAIAVGFLREGDAEVGDLVVTGAGHPSVPEGLVLGEVTSFDDDDRDGAWTAEVRPLRDLDTLASVLVLRPAPVPVGALVFL